ncbi:hypothetical protein C4D60_Mb01t32820 [Musa balbisiana]|uniref:PNPLA domain-containing protein n=1 Tax=Musa balbisiana TaxID=52838 RepID=A0A4S8JSE1_MUSBA|nr:hypothetical protein C4D60_Mb01t32820 [Musa balbisiana]
MDITNEATVDASSIGQSTIVGRTIALRVLLCGSLRRLRRHLARLLRVALRRLSGNAKLPPLVAFLRPRHALGILALVSIAAFALRRFANERPRTDSTNRRKFWRDAMGNAITFEEWLHAAKMLDEETTTKINEGELYEEELIRNKLQELRHRRQQVSPRDIICGMRADLIRNVGNMCNPELHRGRLQEAYDMTGRVLCITVCSARKHEPPRCLNYLTSPHVVIWSAVTASCAFPGLFEAQELMAKDRFGEIIPYHAPFSLSSEDKPEASARRWRDGSLESDLPMIQIQELFNVNHFIVSQANPHIAPLLRLKEIVRVYGGNFAAKLARLAEMELKHRCNQFLELGFPLGGIAKLFAQDWEGDVTVVMPATLSQYLKIVQNPSCLELQMAANQGRRCTWEKLPAMKANCAIELALDECILLLDHKRRLKRYAERASASQGHTDSVRLGASRRIPSWNCIARENSSGSLEEDVLADAAASIHHGTATVGQLSHRPRPRQSMHDGSDGESETNL